MSHSISLELQAQALSFKSSLACLESTLGGTLLDNNTTLHSNMFPTRAALRAFRPTARLMNPVPVCLSCHMWLQPLPCRDSVNCVSD